MTGVGVDYPRQGIFEVAIGQFQMAVARRSSITDSTHEINSHALI